MDTMNVSSSNNYVEEEEEEEDEEETFDEEGEGLIEPTKGRSANYTVAEDVLLCKTWCNVSMDATVGADQNRDTYWARMKEYFDKRNKSGIERTDRSLRSRWSTISTDCQKYAGCVANYERQEESGGDEGIRVRLSSFSSMYLAHTYLAHMKLIPSLPSLLRVDDLHYEHVSRRREERQERQCDQREGVHLVPLLQGA
jgi:hypothetical protein